VTPRTDIAIAPFGGGNFASSSVISTRLAACAGWEGVKPADTQIASPTSESRRIAVLHSKSGFTSALRPKGNVFWDHLSVSRRGYHRGRAPYACPHRPGNRQPALLDEAVRRAAVALDAVSNARLNHGATYRAAAVLHKMRNGPLDAGPNGGNRIGPAGSNILSRLAAVMLHARSHAGLHDRLADRRSAFPHSARAGMRGRLRRYHADDERQQPARKSCWQAPGQDTCHLNASRHRR